MISDSLGVKDNLGVITEVEVELLALTEVNAGGLWWTGDYVTGAVAAYFDWTDSLPDEMCSSILVMSMPDADFAPPTLRGKHFAHVRLIHPGDPEAAAQWVRPLRLAPGLVQDTFGRLPVTELGSVHAEPDQPTRFEAQSSRLDDLDQRAKERLLGALTPDAPFLVEVRHLRGKLGQSPTGPVSYADADFGVYTGQAVPAGADRACAASAQREFHETFAPWRAGSLVSFLSGPTAITVPLTDCYDTQTLERLRQVKALADPTNLFRLNVNVPPAAGARPSPHPVSLPEIR